MRVEALRGALMTMANEIIPRKMKQGGKGESHEILDTMKEYH